MSSEFDQGLFRSEAAFIGSTRTYEEDERMVHKESDVKYRIDKGFVEGMHVPGYFYVNDNLKPLIFGELESSHKNQYGSFLPAIRQIANVATLPGIVKGSIAMPDVHSGYGFSIGNVAAFDMEDPMAVVSPGGVGFDINCGVRLVRTNLMEEDIKDMKESLTQSLFNHIPVGVGSSSVFPASMGDIDDALELGIDWSIREGFAYVEDKEHCEEQGRMLTADPSKVSVRAKTRGCSQLGTLGAGNHYCEIQVVDEIVDKYAAGCMGLEAVGQVVIMIHSGSRGLGHQVATDYLLKMDNTEVPVIDRQLGSARIHSQVGQDYLAAMGAAANFAWVNRSALTHLTRQTFAKAFNTTPDDLDMQVIYDVSHNIAKVEQHLVDGRMKNLLVHRKGATRAFPPYHPLIPAAYQTIGQPVLVGGSMGTNSWILTGTQTGMMETFGSTCHGAGRALSRVKARHSLEYSQVLEGLKQKDISIRVASPKLVMEEAPESYKNVNDVVETCHMGKISNKVVKLRPVAVIKG